MNGGVRALDHVCEWFDDLIPELMTLVVPEMLHTSDYSARRLWADVATSRVFAELDAGPGRRINAGWSWDQVAVVLGMEGDPVRVWIETELDYIHVVTEWPGDPTDAPSPFKRYGSRSATEARARQNTPVDGSVGVR